MKSCRRDARAGRPQNRSRQGCIRNQSGAGPRKFVRSAAGLSSIALVLLVWCSPSWAPLGGYGTSVQIDALQMQGQERMLTQKQEYTVYEIRSSSGTVVREYVSPAGRVFGVAWEGSTAPDLKQLTGTYYDQYVEPAQAKAQTQTDNAARGPLVIQDQDFVLQSGGHMQAYEGKAYVPDLLPRDVEADDIK